MSASARRYQGGGRSRRLSGGETQLGRSACATNVDSSRSVPRLDQERVDEILDALGDLSAPRGRAERRGVADQSAEFLVVEFVEQIRQDRHVS